MKNILALVLVLFFTVSCGYLPWSTIGNSTNTQVVLSEANYKVVATVTGESSSSIVFGFGPSNKRLYARAKADLYETLHQRIDLKNKSYALINITTDRTLNYFTPLYWKKTVILTADVIVFNK